MSVLSWVGLKKSDEQKQSEAADSAKASQSLKNAIALANYRQTSRNQYHNLLTAETTPYQAYSDRLAAMYGTGMSTAGLSANENPVSLRDTGSGAPVGSNYVGWDSSYADPNSQYAAGQAGTGAVHHTGIAEYLNGTANGSMATLGGDGRQTDFSDTAPGARRIPDGQGGPGLLINDTAATPDALSAAGLDANGRPIAGQGPVTSAPRLTSPGPQGPGAGLNFAPRKP